MIAKSKKFSHQLAILPYLAVSYDEVVQGHAYPVQKVIRQTSHQASEVCCII